MLGSTLLLATLSTAASGAPVHEHPKPSLDIKQRAKQDGSHLQAMAYGVQADGVHDDTAALQAAVNAARGTNNVIVLPNGTIVVSKPILFETNTSWAPGLRMSGQGVTKTSIDCRVAHGACIVARSTLPRTYPIGGYIRGLSISTSTHPPNLSLIHI